MTPQLLKQFWDDSWDEMDSLHALYLQACGQRDILMDQQRSQIAAIRGKLQ